MSMGGVDKNHSEESDQSVHTPDDQAPNYNLSGAAINQETIEAEVKVAQAVEPEIALDAQHELDEQQKQNEEAEQKAQEHKIVQDERLPADIKKAQQSLQDAKDKLRKGESEEQHKQRLANEERLRREALQNAPVIDGRLAHEAVEKIKPRLSVIEDLAAAANAQREEENAQAQTKAQEAKAQNEAHAKEQAEKLKKAQEHAAQNLVQFTQGEGKPIKTAVAQGKKIQELQAQLNTVIAHNEPTVKSEAPVVGTTKVTAIVNAFNRAKEVKPTQSQEPRRSQRIRDQVGKLEAEQKAQTKAKGKAKR